MKFNQLARQQAKNQEGQKVKQDFQQIMDDQQQESDSQNKNQLKKVSNKFESIFVGMMFKEMKDAGFKSKLLDSGLQRDIFEDMYYDKLAKKTAKNSKLGIAEATYRQLKRDTRK